jgi:hypothetical protein
MVPGEGKISYPRTDMATMVSGTGHSQADAATRNEFRQVRTPSVDKKNDLSFARPWGFVYTAINSQRAVNAIGTVPTFCAYSLYLVRKIPLS